MTARVRLAGAALGLAAALVASGCSQVSQITQEVAKQAMLPSIAVGECTNLEATTTTTQVDEIAKVPCDKAHGWETYAEKQYAIEDPYPGTQAIEQSTAQFCEDQFESFVGVGYDDSELEMQYMFPTEQTWTALIDRTITCLVGTSSNDLVGTVKGTKQ